MLPSSLFDSMPHPFIDHNTNADDSDVLRRRFQVNTMSGMGYQYNSISGAILTIVKQEGFMGLYKGITPNLLKVAPSMAASWWTFEFVRDILVALSPREEI
jgi:solute carrier family 25 phosphate transporter 23/24/25/41